MKKRLLVWQIFGFVFTGILGVILHFIFDWTNQSIIVAPFSAVNESIWEHMKLLFFPMLFFALIESRYIGKDYKSFWYSKLIGIVVAVASIPVLYYTINAIFGSAPDFVNIAIFYVAAAIGYILETYLMKKEITNYALPKISLVILLLIAVLFAVLTFIPLQIPLLKDPITKAFGYYKIK